MSSVRAALARFTSWWFGELKATIPDSLRARLQRPQRRIVLSVDGDAAAVLEEGGRSPSGQAPSTTSLSAAVDTAVAQAAARSAAIELRLPHKAVLVRQVPLPSNASAHFPRMLALDLERSTPFRLSEIYSAFVANGPGPQAGQVQIAQYIVKRGTVDPLVARVQEAGGTVEVVSCWDRSGRQPVPIDFKGTTPPPPAWRTMPALAYAALAVILAAAPLVLQTLRHQSALDATREAMVKERVQAGVVQRTLERARETLNQEAKWQKLRVAHPSALAIIEHLSRVLPDWSHLSDLRIDGDLVEISGVASRAASLPQLLERSGAFTEAMLVSPLTLDAREDGERFSIRARYLSRPLN